MAKLTKAQTALLEAIFSATNAGGYEFASGKDQKALLDAGLVEANAAITNDQGATATRTTDSGNAFVNELYANQSNQSEGTDVEQITAKPSGVAQRPSFSIVGDVAIPNVTRTRTANSLYPFDDLEIGQSFFVPASEDKPNPAKSLASTVTSANDRYAHEVEGETEINRKGETVPKKAFDRRFIVRAVEDGAPWGFAGVAGAGVWRIDPNQ